VSFQIIKLSAGADPVAVLKALGVEPGVFFLDSSDSSGWSYIGVRPARVWRGRTLAAWDRFKFEARALISSSQPGAPVPFPAGIMGAVSYDFGLLLEGVGSRHREEVPGAPLFSFGYYDAVLAFSPGNETLFLCGRQTAAGWIKLNEAVKRAAGAFGEISGAIKGFSNDKVFAGSDFDPDEYCEMVRRVLELICAGEIYEVNGSRRFTCAVDGKKTSALDIYLRLRRIAPAPYGIFYSDRLVSIAGSSPELFLELSRGKVLTRPMKGTRPRGNSPREDEQFRYELEQSAKEKAELLMVTDLLRNDLGKVCAQGSVQVSELRAIEAYKNVFQAVSAVEGSLKEGADAFDLLEAAFPGGSVTGCPKHRAVQVIDALERSRRGYYTGAAGYISCQGDMKLNILIRTIFLRNGQAEFSAGGGIVADSDPQQEYEETTLKAQALIRALTGTP